MASQGASQGRGIRIETSATRSGEGNEADSQAVG
jgi:hypothetical protein